MAATTALYFLFETGVTTLTVGTAGIALCFVAASKLVFSNVDRKD
jgi:hypothetical protein